MSRAFKLSSFFSLRLTKLLDLLSRESIFHPHLSYPSRMEVSAISLLVESFSFSPLPLFYTLDTHSVAVVVSFGQIRIAFISLG